ncbi:MAG: hypothetical protein RBR67_13030 [Desulfobacterium sp.]|nr:hypothetical protein [Desulfobacterium sp.]
MDVRSCVDNDGHFIVGIHDPKFKVVNLRENDLVRPIGTLPDGTPVDNRVNFPRGDVTALAADRIYEIMNAFPFRGVSYINTRWADAAATAPESIGLDRKKEVSFLSTLHRWFADNEIKDKDPRSLLSAMPESMLLALADVSTDPDELVCLARRCCSFVFSHDGTTPTGLEFRQTPAGRPRPSIKNPALFDIIANNPCLPDDYKRAMVLTPGIQGTSEIMGEWKKPIQYQHQENDQENNQDSHIFEYLRTNSYIPWGHFAANTADDTVRYKIKDLTPTDMEGMRHLYYRRIYTMVAEQLDIEIPGPGRQISRQELEALRVAIVDHLERNKTRLDFNGSLWGWNFGFGFAQSGYRLHASHQQIHQQYAMIPASVPSYSPASDPTSNMDDRGRSFASFACGDMVAEFIRRYRQETGGKFFHNYLKAVQGNTRTDGNPSGPSSLIVHEDENVIVFVPKAQTSQWELQLISKQPCGNILEADTALRTSLDQGILTALRALESLGARMVTNIEYSKRFDDQNRDQHLVYSFLPRLPHSPGAFSEAQQRWIIGHFPEDFALACRLRLKKFKGTSKG